MRDLALIVQYHGRVINNILTLKFNCNIKFISDIVIQFISNILKFKIHVFFPQIKEFL